MPLGAFFSCVWLVLLALNFMTTFPGSTYSSSSPSTAARSSSSASSLDSSASSDPGSFSQLQQHHKQPQDQERSSHSATAAISPSATAAATADTFCHHSISTKDLSPDCQSIQYSQEEPRMRITGDVNEGPGPPSCPPSCAHNRRRSDSSPSASSKTSTSCNRYLMPKDCEDAGPKDWASIRLRHCCEHSVQDAVPDVATYLGDEQQCEKSVKHLLELDAFIAKVTCQFEQILLRFDCQQNYSVSSCESCKVVYRRWVCAALIPHWRERHKIKPCRSICHAVEQKCPWFLPADKTPGYPAQYAGEPIFQCIDPNILETGEQLERSTYGSGCCYEYCEQKADSRGAGGYHQSQRSRHPSGRVVPCMSGCNTTINDPSPNAKSEFPAACKNYPATSPAPTNAEKEDGGSPAAHYPLSSCPSSSSESSDPTATSGPNDGPSETAHQKSAINEMQKTAPSALIVWLLFCLYFNARVNGWR